MFIFLFRADIDVMLWSISEIIESGTAVILSRKQAEKNLNSEILLQKKTKLFWY